MRVVLRLSLLAFALPLFAQTPYLVKDINTTDRIVYSSNPNGFTVFRDGVYFMVHSTPDESAIYKTDGTSAGTVGVSFGSSYATLLGVVNGSLLFSGNFNFHGLWATDGTAAGTHLLKDIVPGRWIVYSNKLFFSANDGSSGDELWISDGTPEGTKLLKDIADGVHGSHPAGFAPFGGSVFFTTSGYGLWKTDGTSGGTVIVANVSAGNLHPAVSQLFFEGGDSGGIEPWVTDGTEAGTHRIADVLPGAAGSLESRPYDAGAFCAFGNQLLFAADDGVHGRELWISDGTAAGTHMIRDFVPGAAGMWDAVDPRISVAVNRAYFVTIDDRKRSQLWSTDGTDAGTHVVIDSASNQGVDPVTIAAGRNVFYLATDGVFWVTDGTPSGSRVLATLTFAGSPFAVGNTIFFAGGTANDGIEPWYSDGTAGGTHMIANVLDDVAPSSVAGSIAAFGNLVFFTTYAQDTSMYDVWRSDGTDAGTIRLAGAGQQGVTFMSAGSRFFFLPELYKSELMESDGTVSGTRRADEFLNRFGTAHVDALFPFGDRLYVTTTSADGSTGSLWKTTAAVGAAAEELGPQDMRSIIDADGRQYFLARKKAVTVGHGLWTTDGTRAGTVAVLPDLGNGTSSNLASAEGTIFFTNQRDAEPAKLWKSDGTYGGTTAVGNVANATTSVVAAGRKVFFAGGRDLYVSDGTAAGTQVVATNVMFLDKDVFVPIGDKVVFARPDLAEVWASDGTVAGTKRLAGGGDNCVAAIDGVVYFDGSDDAHGHELWSTDGTPEGTHLLADINPGKASSGPCGFVKSNGRIFFSAYTDSSGRELWALPITQSALSIAGARVAEGNSGTTAMHFTVTLSPASTQPVTVSYATSDGTATAGSDYDAASGTLTFAPGETTKSIDVLVHGDTIAEGNETFFVTLRNPMAAILGRAEAAGVIEDDDQAADLSVSPYVGGVSVSNAGPSAANDVNVVFTATPAPYPAFFCYGCALDVIAAGSFATVAHDPPSYQKFRSATATARQADPQPANNSVTWTSTSRTLMMPAWIAVGGSATVWSRVDAQPAVVTSSDPSIVPVPTAITQVDSKTISFTLTALKSGTATITISRNGGALDVIAAAPGTMPRWPGGVLLIDGFSGTPIDKAASSDILPLGTAPISGAKPTGTVTLTVGGKEFAHVTLAGQPTVISTYFPSRGTFPYHVAYSGDENFQPQSWDGSITVRYASATLIAAAQRGAENALSVTVTATGSPIVAPTGTVTIRNGSATIGQAPLVASGSTSTAHLTLTNVSPNTTLTIDYSGDDSYYSGSQQFRLTEHNRPAKH